MQNTRQGLQQIEVGKRVLLQSGIVVDLNLDGRTFYTSLHQLFKLKYKVIYIIIFIYQLLKFKPFSTLNKAF